jgi:L-lactate dehydrogenase complex protein LldG
MSAREEILRRVRDALGEPRPPFQPVPTGFRDAAPNTSSGEIVDLFLERVTDYRATAHRCTEEQLGDRLAAALDGLERVVVPDGFPWTVDRAVRDTGLSTADLDAVDAVVTTAAVGVATTGTIVLDHGPGQGRRALSLVPDVHVCVLREDQVVHDVPQAVSLLDPRRPQTWVSGPSATSDIELDRVEGVHGPRNLRVIVVGSG